MREDGFEVDRATADAWREFQARLGDRLAAMEEHDVAIVEAMVGREAEEGAAPYVQFCAFGGGMLRGEVASDHVLDGRWALGELGDRAVAELGYAAPTYAPDEEPDHGSLNHYVDLEQSEADRLAVMATRALRDVFGVAHPALLCGDVADVAESPPAEGAAVERTEEPLAAFPRDHAELSAMVDRALTPYFGHEPRRDDDGDIPVTAGRSLFFVRVIEDQPVVELFGCVAVDVTDRAAARREVAILNRDVRFAKFRLAEDSIMVDLQLPAWPFVGEHLRGMVAMFTDMLGGIEGDLAERVGGRLLGDLGAEDDEDDGDEEDVDDVDEDVDEDFDEDEDDDEDDDDLDGEDSEVEDGQGQDQEDHEDEQEAGSPERARRRGPAARRPRDRGTSAGLVLAHLEADERGSVDPELAASVCGNDVDVILDLIRTNTEQEIAWREARDEAIAAGNTGESAACEAEVRYAAGATRLLRRALRVVVEREAALDAAVLAEHDGGQRSQRHPRPSASSLAPQPSRRSRRRTVPDPTIEEVDPDIWG